MYTSATPSNPPDRDGSRPVATGPGYEYSLAIEEAADRYAAAGHPRTLRTVQRYCAKGHLDARKVATAIGDKYLIAPYSVARHIAQINEVIAFTASRDTPRPDAAIVANDNQVVLAKGTPDPASDMSRPDAAGRPVSDGVGSDSKYVTQLERENTFLRDQIAIKDTQISELSTRARETNVLIKGLQDLFLRLQPGREPRQQPPYESGASADREVT